MQSIRVISRQNGFIKQMVTTKNILNNRIKYDRWINQIYIVRTETLQLRILNKILFDNEFRFHTRSGNVKLINVKSFL